MVTQSIKTGRTIFVANVNRTVSTVVVVDNSEWGQGYLTVRDDEDGHTYITETHRCFEDEFSAHDAIASKAIRKALGIS